MRKPKLILSIVGGFLVLAACVFAWLVRLDAYLPHDKLQIIMPFAAEYDADVRIIPMGETIYHPKPAAPMGHPGIDFVSQKAFPFIASADGTVSKMKLGGSSDGVDITISHGAYNIVYKEMDPANVFVKVGQKVKQGDNIAMPDPKQDPVKPGEKSGSVHYSTHWEFASASPIRDRFCPLTYFDTVSRTRIEAIWATVKPTDFDNAKQQFPNICSGDYENRVE